MPSSTYSACCFGVISRLADEAFLRRQPVAHFVGVEIRQHRGEQFPRFVDVDELARFGKQRRRLDVGGEDSPVAIEDIRPGGGDRVLPDAAPCAMAVALLGEHDEAQRDDAVDAGEGDNGEAEPRLGLDVAVDVAAVKK